MPIQNISKIKEDIIYFLRLKGPSLPVHIAQEIKTSPLFTSAFLSELFSEKRIKMSNMRIGNSPVYFLSNQEQELEKYTNYLKSKEKEAFMLIKEKQVLKDEEQEPAIKVALRKIKDFAIPFERNNEIYWRYFTAKEIEISPKPIQSKEPEKEEIQKEKQEIEARVIKIKKKEPSKEELNKLYPGLAKVKKKPKKSNDKFLARVKEFLSKENIEIIGIESFSKEAIVLKVKINQEERIFVAYNKKKITEKDLINAHKKAENLGLKYIVLSLGETPKKIKEIIESVKNLYGIEKIE